MNEVLNALSQLRINPVNEEYDLQNEIDKVLEKNNIFFQRECRLGPQSRVDFLAYNGVAIEIKKGKPNKRKVTEQLQRYALFDEVKEIVLVVEKNLDVPKEINGKPCVSFGLNKLWGIAL
jgi:CRISPR/Cas system-associated exonuclease Cas4 (RecB family)